MSKENQSLPIWSEVYLCDEHKNLEIDGFEGVKPYPFWQRRELTCDILGCRSEAKFALPLFTKGK